MSIQKASQTVKYRIINSLEEFELNTSHWNDLWDRCTASNPLGMAELVAFHTRSYGCTSNFKAVVVENEGKWQAAIPLACTKKKRLLNVAVLPNNNVFSTQLLLDSSCDMSAVVRELIRGIRRLPSHLLWFEAVRLDSVEWTVFQECLKKMQVPFLSKSSHSTAIVPLGHPLAEQEKNWDKKQIADIKRRYKKLCELGAVELRVCTHEQEILQAMPICLDIEDKGWKGEGASSILKKGQAAFYTEQAKLLVRLGKMVLYGLLLDGRWIAFQYCFYDKHRTFVQKLSYDPDYRQSGAGQILTYLIFQNLSGRCSEEVFDFVGIYMPYQCCWSPEETVLGQIVLPLNSFIGKSFFFLYDRVMPIVRKFKK